MVRAYVCNNGCEEAGLSSGCVETFLRDNSAELIVDPGRADLAVFFACGLTLEKERESVAMVRRLQAAMRPDARLVVWGCLCKVDPTSLDGVHDQPVIGPRDLSALESLLPLRPEVRLEEVSTTLLTEIVPPGRYDAFPPLTAAAHRVRTATIAAWHRWVRRDVEERDPVCYVRLGTGCLGHCTFCSEKVAWGAKVSRASDAVLEDFEDGLRRGFDRFMLVAGDLGAYGTDIGTSLPELLRRLAALADGRAIRLLMPQLNPRYLDAMFPALEEFFAAGLIELLGCPVQSGSDRILRLMGRRYDAATWRRHMLLMNERYPQVRLRPQFMVGFPGETEEDFRATLRLLDAPLFLHDVKIFRFASRPTVAAARLPGQVPDRIKAQRYRRLSRRYARVYAAHAARNVWARFRGRSPQRIPA